MDTVRLKAEVRDKETAGSRKEVWRYLLTFRDMQRKTYERNERGNIVAVSDEAMEKALDYLRDTATEAAERRAARLYLEDYSRVLRATIMSEHLMEPVNAQERYAYADTRYQNHLEALKTAIYEDEKARFLREAAAVKIEVWRSEQANERQKL